MHGLATEADLVREVEARERRLDELKPEALPDQAALWCDYTPLPVASGFHGSGARYLTALAGVQSGKSYAAVREFVKRIYQDRAVKRGPLQYWAVAPTYPLTRRQESLIRQFLMPLELIVGEMKSERILRLKGNITIQFKSGSNPDYLVAEPVDGEWIDEAARLKESAWRDNLEGRTTSTQGWHIFTTASKGRNWFYKTLMKPADDGNPEYATFNWKTSDNVAVPGIQAECERKKRELPAAIYRREYEASLDAFEGQVYEEWSEAIHLFAGDPPPLSDIFYGFDLHPSKANILLAIGRDGDGRPHVIDETVKASRTLVWWAEEARRMMERWGEGRLIYDPSRGDCQEYFEAVGIYTEPGDNAVAPGIECVMIALHPVDGVPNLLVHERCTQLREEFPAYQYGGDEKPIKVNDHALDALRYGLYTQPAIVRGLR